MQQSKLFFFDAPLAMRRHCVTDQIQERPGGRTPGRMCRSFHPRSCPCFVSGVSPPLVRGCGASPGGISSLDGHRIVKVHNLAGCSPVRTDAPPGAPMPLGKCCRNLPQFEASFEGGPAGEPSRAGNTFDPLHLSPVLWRFHTHLFKNFFGCVDPLGHALLPDLLPAGNLVLCQSIHGIKP